MKELSDEELLDEKTALTGLSLRQRMPKNSPRERAPIDQYHYPPQECSIRPRDKLHTLDEQRFGEVVSMDPPARTIDVKKLIKLDGLHPRSVFAHSHYGTEEQSNSILRLADWIVANGIDSPGDYRAARDLLLRNCPRLAGGQSLAAGANEMGVNVARRLGLALDHSVLPIQGPPGAGKTFTGAHMICELVNHGRAKSDGSPIKLKKSCVETPNRAVYALLCAISMHRIGAPSIRQNALRFPPVIENRYVLADTNFSGFRHRFIHHLLCQLRRDAVFLHHVSHWAPSST
jgi:hypothetical protein